MPPINTPNAQKFLSFFGEKRDRMIMQSEIYLKEKLMKPFYTPNINLHIRMRPCFYAYLCGCAHAHFEVAFACRNAHPRVSMVATCQKSASAGVTLEEALLFDTLTQVLAQ